MLRHGNLVFTAVVLMGSVVSTTQAQVRTVVIDSNQPEANVFADSTYLGSARDRIFSVHESTQQITVVPPTVDSWSIPSISQRLDHPGTDTTFVAAKFPYYYRFESVPSGATVYLESGTERRSLGQTPVDYVTHDPIEGEVTLDATGYLMRRLDPGQELWNRTLVLLEMVAAENMMRSDLAVSIKTRRRWIDYAAIGAAVTGGLLAVHFKTKADNRYDRFNETRDPRLKSDVKQLDVYSGIALGTMQVGLGVLAIRLVF